jgi:hypothetical protein
VTGLEHVFRHAGGELIDRPDLPLPRGGHPSVWVATLWLDPLCRDGWRPLVWAPGERGWQLPATLVVGDVVEFGVVALDPNGQPIAGTDSRWFGWLSHATDQALIVVGPYCLPGPAAADAQPVIDEVRCDQLLLAGGLGDDLLMPEADHG